MFVILQCCTIHSKDRAYYTVPHFGSQSQNYDNSEFVSDEVPTSGTYSVIERKYGRTSASNSGTQSVRKERPADVDVVQLTNDFFRANEPHNRSSQADRSLEEVQLQEVRIHNGKSSSKRGESPPFNERAIDVS